MNGPVAFTETTGGVCVGVTFTVLKVGSGLSRVLASSNTLIRLNLSDHFWSCSSILASAEDLVNLLSETDMAGLSVDDLAGFEA